MLCILIITELWLNNLDIVLFLNSLIIPDSHGITVDSYFLSCVSFLPLIGCLSYLKNNSKFWVRQMQMIPKSWIHHCDMVMFLGKLRPPPSFLFLFFIYQSHLDGDSVLWSSQFNPWKMFLFGPLALVSVLL